MKTITISIGNSDNKLSQQRWAAFVQHVSTIVDTYEHRLHFFGGSTNWQPWQNVCWLVEVEDRNIEELFTNLAAAGTYYDQDSVAVVVGDTQFL